MAKLPDQNTAITAIELNTHFGLEAEARSMAVAGLPKREDDGDTPKSHAVKDLLIKRVTARHAALASHHAAIELIVNHFEGAKP